MLATLVTARLIPWLKCRTTQEQQNYILATVRVFVYAAEQVFGAGQGAAKLEYVQEELERRGIKVDIAMIEAAVREMNLLQNWEGEFEILDAENTEADDGREA